MTKEDKIEILELLRDAIFKYTSKNQIINPKRFLPGNSELNILILNKVINELKEN